MISVRVTILLILTAIMSAATLGTTPGGPVIKLLKFIMQYAHNISTQLHVYLYDEGESNSCYTIASFSTDSAKGILLLK